MDLMYYEKEFCFRTSDFDRFDQIKLSAIMDVCQFVSGEHADIIGVGFDASKSKGYYWVITKLKISKLKNPPSTKNIIISTWPQEGKKLEFVRDCLIKEKDGTPLIKCETSWIVVTEDRKIVRPDKVIFNSTNFYNEKLYNEPMGKLNYEISNDSITKQHLVENSDIDHNGHINNAKYADLILNFWDILKEKEYSDFEICFHHEALLNDVIKTHMFKDGKDEIYVGTVNGEKCFTARLIIKE